MNLATRLVLVIGFFGGLLMLFAADPANSHLGAATVWEMALTPIILAAIVIYPLAFLFTGGRR